MGKIWLGPSKDMSAHVSVANGRCRDRKDYMLNLPKYKFDLIDKNLVNSFPV